MNKKTKIVALAILIAIAIFGIYYFLTKEDKTSSLTVVEKQWIEKNKNTVIDFSLPSDIAIINDNGSGMIFDFLKSLEKDTGLTFNEVTYVKNAKANSEYALKLDDGSKNNISFYEDNYALISLNKVYYNNVSDIKNLTIGILQTDATVMSKYLKSAQNVSYKTYETDEAMFNDLKEGSVNLIAVPKLDYLNTILTNKLNIAYTINEYSKKYVISLGSNSRLNKILTKYLNNYKKNKLEKSFNKSLSNTYFTSKNIDDKKQSDFRSKKYDYGFVLSSPYTTLINGKLNGYNYDILNSFANMAGVDLNYKRYSNISSLLKDFNANNLDIIFDNTNAKEYKMDVYNTKPVYDGKYAVISYENTIPVSGVNSISNQTVLAVKDTKLASYLKHNDTKVKTYDNEEAVIKHLNKDEIAVISEAGYDYYLRSDLKKVQKLGTIDIETDFGFTLRDISKNKIFNEFFDFYLTFVNIDEITNKSYKTVLSSNSNIKVLQAILSALSIVLAILALIFTFKFLKRRKKYNLKLSKADKLRYVDSMTSLKNRDYLNDNIDKWDQAKVFPQTVIIVDLNNLAYINDNFGHDEGDKVIVEAAAVLINNQLEDSEIIRTSGNEFLIYTINHDEKAIITYIRKINKEFKELSHGFGAAIGYSMITDEIKTVDDAINEATIDMRSNKEAVE